MLLKADIIKRVEAKGYTKKDATVILEDVFAVITEALVEGEGVQIHGFGTFEVGTHKERSAIDLQTKERIIIPAYKTPKFRAGKFLKKAIKEGFIRE